jgi:type IV secretory pathway VirB4 component
MDADIERKSRRNALTTSVAAAFPFSSFEICDQNGIMLGINQHNRSVCIVDIFDSAKYSNANMSIMGMSGAGKTFLLQLMALRFREQGVQVFIIAPLKGHEFRPACEAINGKYIKLSPSSNDCINIMDIRRVSLDTDMELGSSREDSLLADKIQKLHIFFMLLKPNLTDEERHYLDTSLIKCYEKVGITHDNASLFNENGSFKEMPVLKDLYDILNAYPESKNLALSLSRFVTGSARRLGQKTNVELENKYIVLDISEMSKDLLPLGMFLALDYCWDKCKESRVRKKVLMLDELWCLIGASSNSLAADYVLEIFKVIRGYGGAAVGATQDLNDFFALEGGKYGKAIINNSRLKVVLPLEEEEAVRVKDVMGLSDEEATQIIRNGRGEGLLCAGRNRISVAFHSTEREKTLITTSREDLAKKLRM